MLKRIVFILVFVFQGIPSFSEAHDPSAKNIGEFLLGEIKTQKMLLFSNGSKHPVIDDFVNSISSPHCIVGLSKNSFVERKLLTFYQLVEEINAIVPIKRVKATFIADCPTNTKTFIRIYFPNQNNTEVQQDILSISKLVNDPILPHMPIGNLSTLGSVTKIRGGGSYLSYIRIADILSFDNNSSIEHIQKKQSQILIEELFHHFTSVSDRLVEMSRSGNRKPLSIVEEFSPRNISVDFDTRRIVGLEADLAVSAQGLCDLDLLFFLYLSYLRSHPTKEGTLIETGLLERMYNEASKYRKGDRYFSILGEC